MGPSCSCCQQLHEVHSMSSIWHVCHQREAAGDAYVAAKAAGLHLLLLPSLIRTSRIKTHTAPTYDTQQPHSSKSMAGCWTSNNTWTVIFSTGTHHFELRLISLWTNDVTSITNRWVRTPACEGRQLHGELMRVRGLGAVVNNSIELVKWYTRNTEWIRAW